MSHGAVDGRSRQRGAEGSLPAPPLYIFPSLEGAAWWRALQDLRRHLHATTSPEQLAAAYARLLGELAAGGFADLGHAAATELLRDVGPLADYAAGGVPAGLVRALAQDLEVVHHALAPDVGALVAERLHEPPPLEELAAARQPGLVANALEAVMRALAAGGADERLELFLEALARYGSGPAALYGALSWRGGELVGIGHPDTPDWEELIGLSEQLGRLERNVEALLGRSGAHHTLLYGPRGSGKSTAVRGLLRRFAGRGLRLVEVPPSELHSLPLLVEQLRVQPTSFVLYVDDLSFEEGETAYRPLRSLLEGSLVKRPANVMVVATSNRRHLVRERLSDRPRPEDDVHGWDTHNERLALSDRFGLTITFPSSTQRQYLEVVSALAALRGLEGYSSERALRFAEWGNGFSGRTARQFVDELRAEAGSPEADRG